MKSIYQFSCLLLMCFLLLAACDSDPCEGVNCDNGVCDTVTGLCLCSRGYLRDSSDICNQTWTEKFVGNYNVSDSCTGSNAGMYSYPVSVSALSATVIEFDQLGSNITQAFAGRFNNSSIFVVDTTLTANLILKGSGSFVDSTIVLNYILSDTINGIADSCSAVFMP